jgi:hypothetical protein
MRVKLLRNLGKNLPPADKEDGDVREALARPQDFLEGQVRDMDDDAANYLVRHKLAEPTDDEVTEEPEPPAPKAKAPQPARQGRQQKFAQGATVEVTDKTLPAFKQTGTVESVAPVSGSGDPFMYTVRRDDGTTFKASEGQLKKA